ncbi:uncharacterized protein [Ranitomeya imitator]|uniref:uncharacterized protein n=1 Tax=Ranitomeya imitator TaxID=111125 RepID=UPI0037E791D7
MSYVKNTIRVTLEPSIRARNSVVFIVRDLIEEKAGGKRENIFSFNEFPNQVEDVMRRWRSIRNQYRRERQQRARSGSAAPSKKHKYIYYDRLAFLDPSMDLRPTQSNLTERETGSDSEVVFDPVDVEEEVAGPSLASSRSILPGPSACTSQDPATSVQDAAPPPTAAPDPVSQEDHGHSSSPTVPLVSSPQAAGPLRRGRRRRELQDSRRNVEAGVLNYLARAATDDGEEAFACSLARYLRPLPREVRLRVRGCIHILIDLCTFPNDPYEVFEFIERRQLSPHNLLHLPRTQQVHGEKQNIPSRQTRGCSLLK